MNCEIAATAARIDSTEVAAEGKHLGALGWIVHGTAVAWCLLCLGFLPAGLIGILKTLGAGWGVAEGPVGNMLAWAIAITTWVLMRGSFKAHRRGDPGSFRKYLRACSAVVSIASGVIVWGIIALASHGIRSR